MSLRLQAAVVTVALFGCQGAAPPPPSGPITPGSRTRALQEAAVWHAVDTANLDVRVGPEGSLPPGAAVECKFVVPLQPPGGNTPKFLCRLPDGRVVKVKYGPDNMEVHSEIFGSRLLWLLGFYSDRVDPVRVRCQGCPEDPWDFLKSIEPADPRPAPVSEAVREFAPALIETYFGDRIESRAGEGLTWPDLLSELSADPIQAEAQQVHREALTLLAAFLGHGDSKPGNQTLACMPEGGTASDCVRSVAYIGDLGSILGHGWHLVMSKVDIEAWENATVWEGETGCVARFRTHRQGTLFDTPISETGRQFLAERLAAVQDHQLRALFDVAGLDGVGGEVEEDNGDAHPPSLDDWVRVFRAKQAQIEGRRCAPAAATPTS